MTNRDSFTNVPMQSVYHVITFVRLLETTD